MNSIRFAAIAAAALAAIASPGVRAADPEFRRDYARSAVEQVHRAEHIRTCGYLLGSGRFSPDWQAHYNWCPGAHHHEADEEGARRHEALERCEFH
nr:hypothetical protein [uncultured Rhodopila sp.]